MTACTRAGLGHRSLGLVALAVGALWAGAALAAPAGWTITAPKLRPFPPMPGQAAAGSATPTKAGAPDKAPTEKLPAPEAAVDAGAKATPDAGTKPAAVDAGAPKPAAVVDAGAPAPAPAPTPPPAPAPVAAKPPPPPANPPVAAKPPAEPAPAAAPVPDGLLDLTATEPADVFVDGRKVGSAPLQGLKMKAGKHKVRFDCYDAAGNTTPGAAQTVDVPSGESIEIEFKCPAAQ